MLWNFHFLPISCTSGQHSFFKRPCWVKVFHPEKPAISPPPFSVVFAQFPCELQNPRRLLLSPEWNWTEVPGRSPPSPPPTPDRAKWEGHSPRPRYRCFLLPTCWNPRRLQVLPHENCLGLRLRPSSSCPQPCRLQNSCQLSRGPREKRKSREKAARGKRFQIPPCSSAPHALGSWGRGGGDRARKVWEKELHGSRTRTGKACKARGAGAGAKEVTAPPSSGHWGWSGICHWLRPPEPPPAPPPPALTALG